MTEQEAIASVKSGETRSLSLAALGALIGDPVRAAILLHPFDGSRRPATELAYLAGASPQAASAHLARLVEGGLLVNEKLAVTDFSASRRVKLPRCWRDSRTGSILIQNVAE